MKKSLCLFGFFFWVFTFSPNLGFSAIGRQDSAQVVIQKKGEDASRKGIKKGAFKERMGKKVSNFRQKLRGWWVSLALQLPTGKLMTTLVLLLLSILFFALSGITIYSVLFGALGSVAVIGALLFFVLWLTERAKATKPAPID